MNHVFRILSTDSDDYTHVYAMTVGAPDRESAERALVDHLRDGDGDEWRDSRGDAWDSRPEPAGGNAFYRTRPCDCGEDGCEDGGHESVTHLCVYEFVSSHARSGDALDAARKIAERDSRRLSFDAD